jgi:SpoVK/Ycf46/Vps4 family AAA+-type ATPase
MNPNFKKEIEIFLRSRFTLIGIASYEEERIISEIMEICVTGQRSLYVWDLADYFTPLIPAGTGTVPSAKDPQTLLDTIEKMEGEIVFILRDFHQCWQGQPRIIRKLRNLSRKLKFTRKSIILTMPRLQLPEELKDDIAIIEYPPPNLPELDKILQTLTDTPGVRVELTELGREKVLRAALGLSSNQAQRVFAKAIVTNGVLDERDIDMITSEKKQIIRESGALEFFSPSETIADVGGLEVLKEWLRTREEAFRSGARDYGLPEPKGIALIGIPGTGKSLTAKTIAGLWHLPLIKLDMGALFGGLVGQSEENTRRALALAETIAPCLLWIDEIEKGLATGSGDSGTSMRVFGSILSWMQEKTKPVFVVATANNIAALPPELLRKGRFDEIFFLDLPTRKERKEIFEVHIKKRMRPVQSYNTDMLAEATEGYVGAEIEQAVIDAMYFAYSDKRMPGRDFTTLDILEAIKRQVPMSRSQFEVVSALRSYLAEGRAQSASFREKQQAQQQFVNIQIDPIKP